jgi:hypothetical protein
MKSRIFTAIAVAVLALTHECLLSAADGPKLTVRVSPLVRLTRGDARGVVTVPRHADNRMLRVVLESEDYYTLSELPLDGEDAAQNHLLYWRDLPPGSYRVTIQIYSATGLRDFTIIGDIHALPQKG